MYIYVYIRNMYSYVQPSVLDYICNPPISSNPADSNQPLLQYLAISYPAEYNLPILQSAPCLVASS